MTKIREKGFTLIELLVVVSVLLISVGVAGDLVVTIIRSYNKTRSLNEVEQNGNYALAKLSYDLKKARSLTSPTALGSSNLVTMLDQAGDSITYTIESASGLGSAGSPCGSVIAVTRSVNGASKEPITNCDNTEGVTINVLVSSFQLVSVSPYTFAITIYFAVPSSQVSQSAGSYFRTSVVMLGASY